MKKIIPDLPYFPHNSFWKNTCILWARPCINKKIYVFDNFKLPLLRRYSITGWIVKKLLFPFSKIMKNWDLHFRILLVIVFCSGLFPVVFITIWIKGFWYNFFHYFVGSTKTGSGACGLKRLGEGHIGEIFSREEGGDTPMDTIKWSL